MAKVLYNEGRVLGYSAYEMYVKHALSVDPNTPPASELEWLSSNIANGTSMLLRVGEDKDSNPHYREIAFPENTRLCAANTIIGSFFIGEGAVPDNVPDTATSWCTKVTDYGKLISNTDSYSPSVPSSPIRPQTIENWSQSDRDKLKQYMKIVDGIVIQPGTWVDNENKPPTKDYSPKLSTCPKLRLFLNGRIERPFFILLTGFTLRTVIQGVSSTHSAVNTASPQDGDFLGPAAFPWSNKVVFSVPPSYVNYFLVNNYKRTLGTTRDNDNSNIKYPPTKSSQSKTVSNTSVIDLESDPHAYYKNNDIQSEIVLNVDDVSAYDDSSAVLTVYQRSEYLPPALFGTKVNEVGINYLSPIDTIAPGTLKLYRSDDNGVEKAKELEKTTPNNTAFIRDSSSYVVSQINNAESVLPISDNTIIDLSRSIYTKFAHLGWFAESEALEGYQNIKGGVIYKHIYGILPDNILNRFGMEWSDAKSWKEGLNNARVPHHNENAYELLDPLNEDVIKNRDNYKYLIVATSPITMYSYSLFPVRKSDNVLDIYLPHYIQPIANGRPVIFNFAVHRKYLGAYDKNSDAVGSMSSPVYRRDVNACFLNYMAYGPAVSMQKYDHNTIEDLFFDSQISENILEDFKKLSLWDFLVTAMQKDVGTGASIANSGQDLRYIYDPNKITLSSTNAPIESCPKAQPILDNTVYNDYMSDSVNVANLNCIKLDISVDTTNIGYECTSTYPNTFSEQIESDRLLVSKNTAGTHTSKSISLTNKYGDMLSLLGSRSVHKLGSSNLNWVQLLSALDNNKSIDILGNILKNYIRYRQSEAGYITLEQDADFVVTSHNGFTSYDNTSKQFTDMAPRLLVKILPSEETKQVKLKDPGGSNYIKKEIPISISIKIYGEYKNYMLGMRSYYEIANLSDSYIGQHNDVYHSSSSKLGFMYYNPSPPGVPRIGFAFKHGNDLNSDIGAYSRIFSINFVNEYQYLNDPECNYRFYNTSPSSSGIWNISKSEKLAFGASWDAKCRLTLSPSQDKSLNYLTAYAVSYADGYNSQLNVWSSDSTNPGADLWSKAINLELSGVFYLQDSEESE